MSRFATDSSTFVIQVSSAGNGAESIIKVSEYCSKNERLTGNFNQMKNGWGKIPEMK
jgi:hypothetical protein